MPMTPLNIRSSISRRRRRSQTDTASKANLRRCCGSLISEGRIVYQTVQTQEDNPPITVMVTKNGPIAAVITSARANIEAELMTRLMVVESDESGEQTMAIIRNTLSDQREEISPSDVDGWIDFQRWLEVGGPYEVAIPFLQAIRKSYGDRVRLPLRHRRDLQSLLVAVKTSAIIHQAQRERDERGDIIAEVSDYETAHSAFDHDIGGLYGIDVPSTTKDLLRAIERIIEQQENKREAVDAEAICSAKVTYKSLKSALGINSNDTIRERLKDALESDLIELVEPPGGFGKTTARRYRVLVPSVDLEKRRHHSGIFPSPDAVRKAMQSEGCTGYTACTAVSQKEGGDVSGKRENVLSGQEPEDLSSQEGKGLSTQETVEIAPKDC